MQTTLTRILLFLNQFHTVCPKIETQRYFVVSKKKSGGLQKNQVVSKKTKKGSSPKLRLIFRPKSEIQTFRSSPKLKLIFRPKSEIQTFQGGAVFLWGGLFSIFHKKLGSKPPKTCDFAYFTSQLGGSSPPAPPGYATVWETCLSQEVYCNSNV